MQSLISWWKQYWPILKEAKNRNTTLLKPYLNSYLEIIHNIDPTTLNSEDLKAFNTIKRCIEESLHDSRTRNTKTIPTDNETNVPQRENVYKTQDPQNTLNPQMPNITSKEEIVNVFNEILQGVKTSYENVNKNRNKINKGFSEMDVGTCTNILNEDIGESREGKEREEDERNEGESVTKGEGKGGVIFQSTLEEGRGGRRHEENSTSHSETLLDIAKKNIPDEQKDLDKLNWLIYSLENFIEG